MFGPNKNNHSHRDDRSITLIEKVRARISKLTGDQYDILFIPSSASLAMEMILRDLSATFELTVDEHYGKFNMRWNEIIHHVNTHSRPDKLLSAHCAFETSCSRRCTGPADIIDAVSSWPYYPIPGGTKVFLTCANKQLGAGVGLSIIGVRKDFWSKMVCFDESSLPYFSLGYYKQNPIPFSMPIEIFSDLALALQNKNLAQTRKDIEKHSALLTSVISPEDISGERIAPVITVKKSAIPAALAKDWELYGYNNAKKNNYQFFTYTGTTYEYKTFTQLLKQWDY